METIIASLPANFLTLLLFGVLFVVALVFLFVIRRTEYILYFLLVWFPLETVLLKNPLNKWLFGIVLVALLSLLVNRYAPSIWILGLRQTLRFVLVFFVVLNMRYDRAVVKRCLLIGLSVLLVEAGLGILQYVTRGALDQFLFASDTVSEANKN